MTEEQLRDVLTRVVPEPPDSVADPVPVVRAARRQRRVATAVASGVAVLAVVGTVFGIQAIREDPGPDVVHEPAQIPDPYTTAPCPDPTQPLDNGEVTDLDAMTAVRHCTRPLGEKRSLTSVGPADALVVDLDRFASALRDIPDADPARCATISVLPSGNRVLFQLVDGSVVAVATGLCDDVELEDRTVDGNALLSAMSTALREQRDDHEYTTSLPAPEVDWCGTNFGYGPAHPSSEHLVAATWCGPNSPKNGGVVLDEATVARLDAAWRSPEPYDPNDYIECGDYTGGGSGEFILARTDRGDVVWLEDKGCDKLGFSPAASDTGLGVGGNTLVLDFAIDELG